MANERAQAVLQRQLAARAKLWPELTDQMLWKMEAGGWIALPRLMPLMMSIMDDLSGTGFPVSRTYLEMWSRLREEGFLSLNRPEEMAFHAGFEGQRAVRTWKDRVQRLADLGFIGLQPGALGDLSYAVFYNPYHVVRQAHERGAVQPRKWHALVVGAIEIGVFDLDDGAVTAPDDADAKVSPGTSKPKAARSSRRVARARRSAST